VINASRGRPDVAKTFEVVIARVDEQERDRDAAEEREPRERRRAAAEERRWLDGEVGHRECGVRDEFPCCPD